MLCRGTDSTCLRTYDEIPSFLQGNPCIRSGYRVELRTKLSCLKSLFWLSNETVNVWSHLVAFLYFVVASIWVNCVVIPDTLSTWWDHFIFTFYLTCFQISMLFSACFHLFNCCGSESYKWWLRVDLVGVTLGLCGCYIPGVYYAFHCHEHIQMSYIGTVCLLVLLCSTAQLHPLFLSHRWHWKRLVLYSAVSLFGIIPFIHWITTVSFAVSILQLFYPKVLILYLLGSIGALFYATRFPEKFFPGHVDLFGASHQWWHILTALALVWWHLAAVELFLYRVTTSCPMTEKHV
ncbi:progestin and adipoQ receptor family member 3-like [Corticium candelabrum]|uniref:progestin and adipoQ receptor family member 3-like n=1 Tax=Corticium candelabrum TaxID=121492 RepID=UPI002E268899|nr:progestin and adipoQ receptor family member 3-like [Corticium candelabrum]